MSSSQRFPRVCVLSPGLGGHLQRQQQLSDPLKLDDTGQQACGRNAHEPDFFSAWKSGTGADIQLVCPRTVICVVKILIGKYLMTLASLFVL